LTVDKDAFIYQHSSVSLDSAARQRMLGWQADKQRDSISAWNPHHVGQAVEWKTLLKNLLLHPPQRWTVNLIAEVVILPQLSLLSGPNFHEPFFWVDLFPVVSSLQVKYYWHQEYIDSAISKMQILSKFIVEYIWIKYQGTEYAVALWHAKVWFRDAWKRSHQRHEHTICCHLIDKLY